MVSVSVVMSTYNDAACLPETLDSVLAQGMSELELIVVNDGSTDQRVGEILAEYQRKDSRVRLVSKQNEGLTRALMDGCNLAMGEFIARIDVGDVMLPARLNKQSRVLDQYPNCVFVSCWTEFCGPKWESMWITEGKPDSEIPVSILLENPRDGLTGDVPHHGSVMFRKSAYLDAGGYRQSFYYGQDWDLWYRMAELGKYQVVPETLYRARFFPDSISMTHKQHQDEISRCSRGAFIARQCNEEESIWLDRASLIKPIELTPVSPAKNVSLEPGFYFIGEALRRRGDARCRKYLTTAMRQSPGNPRAYLRWIQSLIFPLVKPA
jgi:glycosyltransferase involved in cell wall biosynthesis